VYSTYNLLTVSQLVERGGGGDVQNISANIFEFAIAALVKDMFINIDKNAQTSHSKEGYITKQGEGGKVFVEEIGSTPNPSQANVGKP
jgi:hypothetical protein